MADEKQVITVQVEKPEKEQSAYPWTYLFADKEFVADEDELFDLVEASQSQKKLQDDLTQSSQSLVDKDKKLSKMQEVSGHAFDKLKNTIETQKKLIVQLENRLAQQEEQNNSALSPLTSAVITQAVIAHGKKLTGDAAQKRILEGIFRWLSQCQKVVSYLKENKLLGDKQKQLEQVLFIDKDVLIDSINSYIL